VTTTFSFAYILVKFTDSQAEPITVDRARRLFTKIGRGGQFVVDWFDANTHGSVDVGNSEVFGWFDLEESSTEYNQQRANGAPRGRIIDLGRAAAAKANVDLSAFQNVVVVTNVEVDLFGSTGGVAATAVISGKPRSEVQVAPAVLCQEMIHGLGASEHSRRAGSDVDYRDPWDVMSMFAAYTGGHPVETDLPIGPGLNAAYMDRAGWLDLSRVQTSAATVTLRPLHRRDLPGHLAALVNGWYVEYRPGVGWDSGFGGSRVFVHSRANNTSYLEADLGSGDSFEVGDRLGIFESYFAVTVNSIDDATVSASVTIQAKRARGFVAGPAELFGGVANDGGGFVIVGGKIVKVPPRSPLVRMLERIAALEETSARVVPVHLEHGVRVRMLEGMAEDIAGQLEELTELHTPIDRADADVRFEPRSVEPGA
jgi:hypothetical protein